MKQHAKYLTVIDYICCIVLALAFSVAPYYINNGVCNVSLGCMLTALISFIVLLGIVYGVRRYLSEYDWSKIDSITGKFKTLEKVLSKEYAVFYITIIIFVFWIIPLIFLYPGTCINDTWGQLQQFIEFTGGQGTLSDHHPIFDTMIMGIIIVPLSKITGKWHMMIFLYVLLQAIFTSFAFASTVDYVYKKLQLGTRITIGLLLVYCLLPFYPASVQTVSKDALHSWGFVFFIIYYIEIIRTNGSVLKNKKFLAQITLIVLFCCLTKKVGFYVVIFSLFSILIFQKKNRKYLLLPMVCAIVLMNILLPVIRNNLQIIPGGKQEMFSLPFQMTARYVSKYGDDITEEEYQVIDKVLTIGDLAERYDPTNADPVKDYYQKGEDKDYLEYIKVMD